MPFTVLSVFTTHPEDPDIGRTSVLWPNPETGPWWVVLKWVFNSTSDRLECVGAEVRSCRENGEEWPPQLPRWDEDPQELTWDVWRALPLRSIIRDVRQQLSNTGVDFYEWMLDDAHTHKDEGQRCSGLRQLAEARARASRSGGLVLPVSTYDEVARVYREAWAGGAGANEGGGSALQDQ